MRIFLFIFLLLASSFAFGLTFKDGKQVESNKQNSISKNSYAEIILPDDVDWLDWIDLEILEFCKSSEDVLLGIKSKQPEGDWDTYTLQIKKNENITLHQTADGFEEIYFLNTDTYSGEKKYSDRLLDINDNKFIDLFEVTSAKLLNLANFHSNRFANSIVSPILNLINSMSLLLILLISFVVVGGYKIIYSLSFVTLACVVIYFTVSKKISLNEKKIIDNDIKRQGILMESITNIKYLILSNKIIKLINFI